VVFSDLFLEESQNSLSLKNKSEKISQQYGKDFANKKKRTGANNLPDPTRKEYRNTA